ncbi:DUF1059 domain-containing protein [Aureibaculum sp. 2210JD6-5]|uniref:DUF1059 domain-containing protein n=1 Tax=Aureibaculum sp. 2210JD6-5 TaxID=3103957 RepID=UPI002ABE32EB|nr:DUF1059 domain-containing protein [Aureibaculum sp. 2210JD6-5]
MTCKQLGGPCNKEFHANTFEEMVEQSKKHGMEMVQKGDADHIRVMDEMKEKMKTQTPQQMQDWFYNKRMEFDALPENQ